MSAVPTRPILRYHGGKWLLAPWILAHLPKHRVYVEPFGGAASVLLQKPRSYAEVYNDLDGEIVNVFRVAQRQRRQLMRELMRTPFARAEYRLSFEHCDDAVERARRTIIRSFMGFGSNAINREIKSGFRANANRSGTTPARDWVNYPRSLAFLEQRLSGVVLENKPASQIIEQHDGPETVIYADPPYVHSTRSYLMSGGPDTHGYAHEMTDDDHRTLAMQLREVKGMVVLSGYHSPLYDELYGDWGKVERDAFGDGACERTEVLWLNPAADEALNAHSLFAKGGAA